MDKHLAMEFKRETGIPAGMRVRVNRDGDVHIPYWNVPEQYSETYFDVNTVEIPSFDYIEWLENKIQELKNKIVMKEKFIQFLKDNGALEKFEANLKTERINPYDDINEYIDDILNHLSPMSLISGGFIDSPEGYNYWDNIDIKWQEILCKSN